MRTVLLGAAAAAALFITAPAEAAPPPVYGRITGVVSSSSEARQLPCPAAPAAATGKEHVGVACFRKQSRRWTVDQGPDGCTVKSDATTGFRMAGDCVLAVDEGAHVKVWAPPQAVSEEFRIVWR